MSNHVYKSVEVTGTSPTDLESAIQGAVAKSAESLRNLDWFEVVGIRGHIEDGAIGHYQVTLKLGFRVE